MVTKGEDEQGIEHVQRSQPTRIKLRVGEERLHEDEQKIEDKPAGRSAALGLA
jgi:hypothetical protein